MGTFLGHATPGSFFSLFGIWWMCNIFHRYFYSRKAPHLKYKNVFNFPLPMYPAIPIESIVKVILVTCGIIGEYAVPMYQAGEFYWANTHHMTMYFFFGMNGLIELALHRGWEIPRKLSYVTGALAFGIQGFLFYNHLHGRSHMDVMVHMYLFYLIVACLISTLAEMYQPRDAVPALCRAFFTILQGTWFYQIGFILYPPNGKRWIEHDPHQMMIVTGIFTWHFACILIGTVVIGTLMWLKVNKLDGPVLMNQNTNTAALVVKNSRDRNNNNPINGGVTVQVFPS